MYLNNSMLLEKLRTVTTLSTEDLLALEKCFKDDPKLLQHILQELLNQPNKTLIDSNMVNIITSKHYEHIKEKELLNKTKEEYTQEIQAVEMETQDTIADTLIDMFCNILLIILLGGGIIVYCCIKFKTTQYPFYMVLMILTVAVLVISEIIHKLKRTVKVPNVDIPPLTQINLDINTQMYASNEEEGEEEEEYDGY